VNRIHRARLHPPLSRHPGSAAGCPAGVYYRASLMNDTAAADADPTKGGQPWRS